MSDNETPENDLTEPQDATEEISGLEDVSESSEPEYSFFDDLDDHEGFESIAVPGEDFMKDPTDFHDPLPGIKFRRKLKVTVAVLVVLCLIVGAVFFYTSMLRENKEKRSNANEGAKQTTTTIAPKELDKPLKPLVDQFKDAPEVSSGEVNVTVAGNTVKSADGHFLTINNGLVAPAVTECVVTEPTDFCLTAQGAVGAHIFDIYYMKDALNSRLFENPETFEKVEVANASAAGVLPLSMGSDARSSLVMVNEDSSGWLIVLENGEIAIAKDLVNDLTVE